MLTEILFDLLMINLIVVLIHESGFISYMDDWVNDKWKFYHLPYPIRCALCTTNWISIFYVLIIGKFSLFTLMLCLLNAHLTQITQPLFRFLMNLLKKVIELLNRLFKLDR